MNALFVRCDDRSCRVRCLGTDASSNPLWSVVHISTSNAIRNLGFQLHHPQPALISSFTAIGKVENGQTSDSLTIASAEHVLCS